MVRATATGWDEHKDGHTDGTETRTEWTYRHTHLSIGLVRLDLDQGVTTGHQLGHLALQAHLAPGIVLHHAGEGEHCGREIKC